MTNFTQELFLYCTVFCRLSLASVLEPNSQTCKVLSLSCSHNHLFAMVHTQSFCHSVWRSWHSQSQFLSSISFPDGCFGWRKLWMIEAYSSHSWVTLGLAISRLEESYSYLEPSLRRNMLSSPNIPNTQRKLQNRPCLGVKASVVHTSAKTVTIVCPGQLHPVV